MYVCAGVCACVSDRATEFEDPSVCESVTWETRLSDGVCERRVSKGVWLSRVSYIPNPTKLYQELGVRNGECVSVTVRLCR